LKLKHDKLHSHFACFGFNCNLRPCSKAYTGTHIYGATKILYARFYVLTPNPFASSSDNGLFLLGGTASNDCGGYYFGATNKKLFFGGAAQLDPGFAPS